MIDIIFDGPPGPFAGRFVEVEDGHGKSIKTREWIERPGGFYALRITGEGMVNHFIEVTDADGDKRLIQIACIISVERCSENNSTLVLDNGDDIYVEESVQEIKAML